jgi:predicted PurR-regulated permease PerM
MLREAAKQSNGPRFIIATAAFVIVVAGMKQAASIIIPFLLAAFISIIAAQPLFFLKRKGLPTFLAILLVIAVVVGACLVMALLIGTSLNDFQNSIPIYQTRIQEKLTVLLEWLDDAGIGVPDKGLIKAFNPGSAMKLVARILSGLGNALTNSFLIVVAVIFILLESSSFPAKLRAALDNPNTLDYFDKFINSVRRYMTIKTIVSLATGVSIAIWLAIIGVDYFMLWGLLTFLLNYVPNIGSILAAVPAILLALIQLGTGSALLTGIGYLVVNFVIGNVIEPKVMGKGLGLSTLVVFLSLVFWGWVLGPVGMLLSVPLTMTLKIALDSSEDTRWIAVLLGPETSAGELQATEEPSAPQSSSDKLS